MEGWKAINHVVKGYKKRMQTTKVGKIHQRPFQPVQDCKKYTLCVLGLKAVDGKTDHAIAVVRQFVFDTNLPNALPLNAKTLDFCCSSDDSPGQFETVWRGLAFKWN